MKQYPFNKADYYDNFSEFVQGIEKFWGQTCNRVV